jgi:hypothetical protein
MNDFTKEELEYIKDYIFNGAAGIRLDRHEHLKNKIQSMLDNYCEQSHQHEYVNVFTNPNEFGHQFWKCLICGKRRY